MPRVIIACKQVYPGITVHVKETFPDKSIPSLLAGTSTISVASYVGVDNLKNLQRNLGARNFASEQLLTEPFILYTSKDNPLAKEIEVEVDEAYAYPWIIQQEHNYEENCMLLGEDEICPNSIISFQDKDSVKQAIAADLGVAVMASSFAGEEDPYVAAGLIHRVSLLDVEMGMTHVLITPKKRKFTTVETCFLEELKKFYQQMQK
jgi:DNA-binding transcriptional LysR family regulator